MLDYPVVPVGGGDVAPGRTRGARGAAAAQPVPGLSPSCSRTIGRHSDPSRGRFRAPWDSCPPRSLTPASERNQCTLARALARPRPRRTSATSVPSKAQPQVPVARAPIPLPDPHA
eukprot:scaffold17243_cov61-Phaeocystis_antarctica.AAC.4